MLNVNSKKAVKRLSDRNFTGNKSRNIVATFAIALTAVLFTALFTVGSGMIENFQRQTMRQAGGDGMAVLKYINDEEYENVKNHKLIDEISYNRILSESIDNQALLKRHGELYYMDDIGLKLGFCEPTSGKKPIKENEIIMDTKTMKLLGVEEKVGSLVTLEMTVHGKKVKRDFVLSGWWEADPVFNVSMMVASRAYVEKYADELYNSYRDDSNMTGVINSYVMFKNSLNLENKIESVIKDSGYSIDEDAPNYIAHNVNWSYISSNFGMDIQTILGIGGLVILIIFTGYMIIYNIFQISVIKDIRFYGLLKTIGTTGKQIKAIIRRQALILSCLGIPIGLVAGYFIGCGIVPMIMDSSYYASVTYQTSANPLIFIGSTAFVLVTVAISIAKPRKIASKVSPVEAVRYTDNSNVKMQKRKSRYGAKITGMAAANLGRNKKRTILVILSMSLSIVLFNTIYTFSIGFDMDKFLSTFVDTDYLIAHADYFNYRFAGPSNSVTESMIEQVQTYPGFIEGGRLYGNIFDKEGFSIKYDGESGLSTDKDTKGNLRATVYGLEDLPLERLSVLEGEIDFEKLKTGKYILEGVHLNDHGEPEWGSSHYDIGDTVILNNYKNLGADNEKYNSREFEVMAKVAIKTYTNSCGIAFDYNYYIPADIYKEMIENPGTMSYAYNVEESEDSSMEVFLQNYTEVIEPTMNYSSKNTREKEFLSMRNMVLIVGGILSFIVGLIGILNFINSMLTSILTRRREFAMLQSIGMTANQLHKMLITEGLMYALMSAGFSIVLGIASSLLAVKSLSQNLWFFSYEFTAIPLAVTIPILIIIGLVLPSIVLNTVKKQSVVERLRETEY